MGYSPVTVELHIFIPKEEGETHSILHEDDGESFAYRRGEFYRTEFVLRLLNDTIMLAATVKGLGYSTFARKEFVLVFHGPIFSTANTRRRRSRYT